jgi:hypothetical protein
VIELVDAIAAYRLTRLVTADVITAPVRDSLVAFSYVARDGDADAYEVKATHGGSWSEIATDDPASPWLATLVTCRWCAGWWISWVIVWARRRHPRTWNLAAEACTLSAAAALLARLEQ